VLPTLERVVDRWPFPRALLDLFSSLETKWICEGLLARARLGVGSTNGPALVAFASPSETLSGLRCPLGRLVERGGPNGLPQLASLDLGSSHGVVIDPPLHRYLYLVSTPGDPAAPKSGRLAGLRRDPPCDAEAPSARSCHLPDSFRPCRSSRLRRFAPPGTSQVCCTLKPILGFARLQVVGALSVHLPLPNRGKPQVIRPPSRAPRKEGPSRRRRSGRHAHTQRCVRSCRRDQVGRRHPPTIPTGATPFEAFPSPSAVPRQPLPPSALQPPRRLGKPSPPGRPGCGSAGWYGPPRSMPSRRWSQVTRFPAHSASGVHGARVVPVSSTSRP
jgi:hypothetical protein